MASNYTRYIEFKVKGQELTRAVDRIFKGVNKIEISVEKVNKKVKITGDVIKDVEKNVKKADTAVQKLAKDFEKVNRAAQRTQSSIGKMLDKMRAFRPSGGSGGGILRTVAEFGALEVVIKRLIPAVYQFASAHTGLLTGVAAAGAAFKVGIPTIYSWGKAVRQAEQSTKDFIRIAGSSNLKKAVQSMFPAGSYLGGNRDLAAEKASADLLKKKAEETKKLEKSAEKVAKTYKLIATGLNKSREQLSKLKKIQDQLLSSSKGYENVTKKILNVEKEITKEERKRAGIRRKLDWKGDAKKFAMNAIGGRAGAFKLGAQAVGGLAGGAFVDDGIKRISAALGKQVGLFKVVTVSASKFFQGLKAVDQGARRGAAALDKYGRIVVNLVREHARLIQATTGLVAGLDAVARFAPTAYRLGKGWRQLEFDIRKATAAVKKYGLEAGILSFADKGSHAGKRFRNLMKGRPEALKHDSFEKELGEWGGQYGASGIRSQVDGLNKVGEVLKRNQEIQKNISANIKGPYLQAAVAVKKAQFHYNLELRKTQLIQRIVTGDIWLAKKGLADMVKLAQGVAGAIKGLGGGIVGGLLGGAKGLATGKAGTVGQAAVVIGISDAVKRLSQHIPFISKAWKDNLTVFATWTKRVTEGLTGVLIAHTAFSKAISAAQWTIGAISGFARWEKEAMLSFHRVRKGWQDLAHDISKWQVKGMLNMRRNNPLTNAWDKMVGGRRGDIADIYNEKRRSERPRDPAIVRMERALKTSQEMLKKTDTAAANYEQRQQRVLRLERRINAEMDRRRVILESMTPRDLTGQSSFVGKQRVRTQMAMNRGHKFSGFGDWSSDQTAQSAARKADAERERRLQQVLAINKKLEASGKRQLATWNLLSQEEQQRRNSATDLAAFKETYLRDRKIAARQRLSSRRKFRADRNSALRENLMLGAGFPVLFGGGLGAIGGGLAGATVQSQMGKKGGFGAQILLSALGQQIDAFVTDLISKVQTAATSLKDTGTALSYLSERSLFSSKSLQTHAEILKEQGKYQELSTLLTKEYVNLIGNKGISNLHKVRSETEELNKAWARLSIQLSALLSGPLGKLLDMIGKNVTTAAGGTRLNTLLRELPEDKAAELNKRISSALYKEHGLKDGGNWFQRMLSDVSQHPAGKAMDLDAATQKKLFTEFAPFRKPGSASITPDPAIGERLATELQAEITLLRESAHLTQRELEIQKEIKELKAAGREDLASQVRLKYQLVAQNALIKDLYNEIGGAIQNGMVNAIESAIEGTKTLGEVASSVFRQIARMMIQFGVSSAFGPAGLGWLPGRAAGGPVTGGESYLVGEKGPEIFTPGKSGGITPNNQLGGTSNVTINVDAGGSSMNGDAEQAGQLGRMLAAAVQDEMARQKRPGGILY